ncbi:glycosyltransferase [Sulfurovum sp. ST-21]|uniref:Glycosyltransferase n=1 Tax=Sulfurovum indicum TaxID=2779528 RepID=A0A7M1S3F2_9BACT|nr:glycosyltransferase [Sulfurovum indicum]QOR61955.1 glycosyltransferase [Sulfurovum indicum]
MKNLLYIDRAFVDAIGGDKNRSRYLYRTLQKYTNVYTCIIKEASECKEENASLELPVAQKGSRLLPDAIAGFSEESKERFVSFIRKHGISVLFFRTIAFSPLALYAQKKIPGLDIIIDADLILSRLMDQAWKKNRSFAGRYYLIEKMKLSLFEKKLYKHKFTFLFSNEEECRNIKDRNTGCQVKYLPNTTHLRPKQPDCPDSRVILFYGAMDSTANRDAYAYIHDTLYDAIKDDLEQNDYEIHVVGKGCDALAPSRHERIKILGKVDSIEEVILKSSFVLLPIYIASGTNTRVIETAMAGRALLTTPLGMEGLSGPKEREYVASDMNDMAAKIKRLMQDREYRMGNAQKLQDSIVSSFSYENFENRLKEIVQEPNGKKVSLVHIPRRFTQKSWGGTETVVMNSAHYLKPMGYESAIYTSKALDGNAKEEMDQVPIRRFDYFYPFFGLSEQQKRAFDAIGGNLFSFSLLFALLRKKKMDIIHLHTLKRMGAIARTVAKWRNIPYVITLHGGYFNIDTEETNHRQEQLQNGFEWGRILGWIFGSRKVMDDAAAIITLSQEEYDRAYKKYGSKVHYLSNGVNVEKFSKGDKTAFKKAYNIPESKKMVLCSARIDTQKNQMLLMEAFNRLGKEMDDLHLVFLGAVSDDAYFETLQAYIEANGLGSKVTFVKDLTPKDQLLVDAYRGAEMLVLPSRHEPFGMVILEAWSAGTPVVASRTGGIAKIITHGRNGLLFENGNDDDLYLQMKTLLGDKTLREALVKSACEDVEQYDWKSVAENLDSIYADVLKNG